MTDSSMKLHNADSDLHTVIETAEFLREAKSLISADSRVALVNYVATNPSAGDLMEGTGGARKFRWGGQGKGKRGGCRVISFFAGHDVPVFLLTIYGKGDKANLSKAERNELRDILSETARLYREGSRR